MKHPPQFQVMFLPELDAGPFVEFDRAAQEDLCAAGDGCADAWLPASPVANRALMAGVR